MKRAIIDNLRQFITQRMEHSPVLIIQGARQVGKSYAVNEALQNQEKVIAFNLEKSPDIKLAIDETNSFEEFTTLLQTKFSFASGKNFILFIDEAQESEKLGRYVRFMKEDWTYTKVLLTGSSMNRLFQKNERVPVGRIEYLHIHPFSFREFLRYLEKENLLEQAKNESAVPDFLHKDLLTYYDTYLTVGGMPAVIKAFANKEAIEPIFSFLIASQRDDFIRKEKVKTYLFLDALKGIANHVGSTSKLVHVADNNYDAKKILELLEEWLLAFEVEIRGSLPTQKFWPKRYLYDIGILRYMRETAIPSISVLHTLDEALRTPLGGIIENAIYLQLRGSIGGYIPISSWKKNNREAVEVDFIKKSQTQTIPIEVKASLNVSSRHFKNLLTYCKQFHCSEGLLISLDNYQYLDIDGIKFKNIPAYIFE